MKNVSISVSKGQIVGLLGEVGSGKSILLQILQKFQNFESGDILINSTLSIKDTPTSIWREHIGIVPQDIKIFNGTLIDNILLGNVLEEGQKVVEFCQSIGISAFFENLPQGYLSIVGEEGINLSGGQKQLVALARALYRRPKVLLLDEATSAMDSKTEKFVVELLEKLSANMCIILVTHRYNLMGKIDHIYHLENGVTSQSELYIS